MLLSNRCWNWNLDKVERFIDTSMCPLRSTPPSSPPIPKAPISTASSRPDIIGIIGSGPKRNSSSSSYDECPVPFYGGALAGCVTGGLADGAGGSVVGRPPGGGGGLLAGCTEGAFAGMEASLPESVATMFVTGGATYLW